MAEATEQSTAPAAAPTEPAEQCQFPLYGGELWSAIVDPVPPAQAADAALMATVHPQLEAAAAGYLTMTHGHHRRFAKGSPARLALQARNHIQAALDYAEQTGNMLLKGVLETALTVMDKTTPVEGFDMLRLSRKRNADPARDLLHHSIMKIWTDALGGTLTTGRKSSAAPGKREVTGPAVRFLVAALKPIKGVAIGTEAAKKIVEKEKKGRARVRKLAKPSSTLPVVI